ncbi:MAG: succinate dehydrogenase cytochrome b subunit [Proteobacteria bacterium]|nr:MAG: succinate dehydrogenase cytochrome b subunit [Pseudomonadota bacterium]
MTGSYLKSSIGKKQLMAITGLAWCGFVLGHMAGNLFYLVGPEAFNSYGHAITKTKEIYYAIEVGLLLTFTLHVLFALLVVLDNIKARPIGYAVGQQKSDKSAASLASRTMKYSGLVILVFTVLHLITFRFGPYYSINHGGVEMRNLYQLMGEVFSNALYVGWYIVALGVLGLHLSHALWSGLQTLGLIMPYRETLMQRISYAYGWIVALGFIANPVYIYFFQRG